MNWVASMVGALFEWFVRRLSGSAGSGAMRAAAFVRYDGAMGAGHLGWGFDFDTNSAAVGAVENPLGSFTCSVATMGFWDLTTGAPVHEMGHRGYNDLKYVEMNGGDALAAYRTVKWVAAQPYALLGRNCMDDAYDVLRSYGVTDLPLPAHDLLPNEWFLQFRGEVASVSSFVWTKQKPTLRQKLSVAVTRAIPGKVPSWRKPGHPDWHDLHNSLTARASQRIPAREPDQP